MRQMIRRLSRVGDCSSPSSPPPFSPAPRRGGGGGGSSGKRSSSAAAAHEGVPEGHVPVYVVGEGDGGEAAAAERFVVRAELLGRPALAELLRRAAQEYGYARRGPIRIPCPAAAFRRLLGALTGGSGEGGLALSYFSVVV